MARLPDKFDEIEIAKDKQQREKILVDLKKQFGHELGNLLYLYLYSEHKLPHHKDLVAPEYKLLVQFIAENINSQPSLVINALVLIVNRMGERLDELEYQVAVHDAVHR